MMDNLTPTAASRQNLMEVVEISGRLRDGGDCKVKVNKLNANKYKLEGGLYHPFYRKRDDTVILFILEDGEGTELGPKDKGMSLPHLITGRKNVISYADGDPFNNTWMNYNHRKEAKRKIKRTL